MYKCALVNPVSANKNDTTRLLVALLTANGSTTDLNQTVQGDDRPWANNNMTTVTAEEMTLL